MFVEPKIENVMTNEFYDLLLSCAENQASKSKDDFVHGGICAIRELWHGSEEEPEGGTDIHRDIIVRGEKGVKIYPNPSNGLVNIETEGLQRLTVTNAMGQVVYDNEVSGEKVQIEMSQFGVGTYLIRIYTESGILVKRINIMR